MSDLRVVKSQFKTWFLIPLIVFIGLILMLFFRLGKPTEITPEKALNRPVPSFELPLLTDTTKSMTNANLPRDPYLINVWGSWCQTCYVEHPFLLKLHNQGVSIVGVNYRDELEDALGYLEREQDPFVFSVQDYEGVLAIDLGLKGAPETFVVDAWGNIRQHIVGEVGQSNWQSRIAPCLSFLQQIPDQASVQDVSQDAAFQKEVAKVCA